MRKAFVAFVLLFATFAFALSDSALLHKANKELASKNKSDIFRAYNDYKNLYLRSIMNQNEALKVKALRGIVQSGKKLHIDVSTYQKELASFTKHSYVKPKPKSSKPSKNIKKVKLKTANKLKRVYWKNGKLILRFSKKLKKTQVNYFKLYNAKKNEYKYVFDIEASMMSRSQNLIKRGIESIKIAQYKPNIIRVVFKNDSVVKIRFRISGNELVINAQPTKKSMRKKKKNSQKSVKSVKRKSSVSSYAKGYEKKTIVIDAGHGGKDPGASGYRRYKEKHVVLGIAKYLRDYLKSRGYRVYMTRSGDYFIRLRNRTRFANKKKADLFISIHANASKNKRAKGIETYFLSPSRSSRAKRVAAMENKADIDDMNYYAKQSFLSFLNNHKIIASNKLAIDLQQGILLELRKYYKVVSDGGVREGPFWVLVGAQMPAVLIEVGFITNPTEARRLVSKNYQKHLAKGIADGVERYFIKNR